MSYSVSVIIPAYKEEEFIEDAIKKLQNKLEENKFVYEIIIVLDKAPDDKTEEIAKKLIKENNKIRLITRANKLGVGSAVKDGIKNSKNETILITTAEISEDPDDLIKLLNKINEGYDLVSVNPNKNKSAKIQVKSKNFVNDFSFYLNPVEKERPDFYVFCHTNVYHYVNNVAKLVEDKSNDVIVWSFINEPTSKNNPNRYYKAK